MKIEVKRFGNGKTLCTVDGLEPSSTVEDVKKEIYNQRPRFYPDRQQLKAEREKKSKALKNEATLESLSLKEDILYFKDLGPQIGWTTVFLSEYAGPLVVYLLFYLRPSLIYGDSATSPMSQVVHIAAICWTFHYAKRLFETVFIHRFSHSTMPIANLFRNCGYYWGFAAFVSYFVNHPLYTPAMYGKGQIYTGLLLFVTGELGNLSIHMALRNLRPPGTRERNIPYPSGNPFTILFELVSCPNYTYETLLWLGFSIMTQSLPGLLFTVTGFAQMAQWALAKHRNYRKDFDRYPRNRKAILPFLL